MQVSHLNFIIMPSQRKRIGYLPSEEIHEIIDKISKANKFSQSKVTGLLVEEALRSRGVLSNSISPKTIDKLSFIFNHPEKVSLPENDKSNVNINDFKINKKAFSDDIKMIHEFIEFKYFKSVMKENNIIFE